ncbi:unnamed protein product [Schistosoma margrebowiei]|uniref:Ubiquitin-like domain-containing protein n=1 Tax=Schistosoma margrebowiei TaxID=48269 RepID=A0A3P8ACR1_9TREM|nr:unnamed protein product [Schistosoma margrebowiei]
MAHDFDLPLNKQILLVSGGFQLEPGDKLSTYGAGLVSVIYRHVVLIIIIMIIIIEWLCVSTRRFTC